MQTAPPKTYKFERIVAVILDLIFFGIGSSVIGFILSLTTDTPVIDIDTILENQNFDLVDLVSNPALLFAQTLLIAALGFFLFVFVPYKMKGQTLGKKLLRIKVVNELGHAPTVKQLLKRGIMVYEYFILVPASILIFININAYLSLETLLSTMMFLVYFIAFFMIIGRYDARGPHDLIANTKVVHVDFDPDVELKQAATKAKDWADVEMDETDENDPWAKDNTTWKKDDDPWEK